MTVSSEEIALKEKSWNTVAEDHVNQVFKTSYVSVLSSIPGCILNITNAFDYCLNKTDGLQKVNSKTLTTDMGWNLWGYLASEAVCCLKMLNSNIGEKEMLDILVSKQKDYGPNNIARFGAAGILIRIHDKIARLNNLMSKSDNDFNTAIGINSVPGETIVDTFVDIIGYSVVALMWMNVDEKTGSPDFLLPLS
jgi:hypothetical protein